MKARPVALAAAIAVVMGVVLASVLAARSAGARDDKRLRISVFDVEGPFTEQVDLGHRASVRGTPFSRTTRCSIPTAKSRWARR